MLDTLLKESLPPLPGRAALAHLTGGFRPISANLFSAVFEAFESREGGVYGALPPNVDRFPANARLLCAKAGAGQ